MGYIDTNKLKEEINKRYQEYRTKYRTKGDKYYEGMADSLDYFEQFIDSLEPSLPSNLDEASEEYALSLSKSSMGGKEYCKQDFKAGAEWQKKQICKDCPNRGNTHSYLQGYEDGKERAFRQFSDILDKWEEHAIEGMKVGASAYHQGKIALICD